MEVSFTIPIWVLWVAGVPIVLLALLTTVAGVITLYNLLRL